MISPGENLRSTMVCIRCQSPLVTNMKAKLSGQITHIPPNTSNTMIPTTKITKIMRLKPKNIRPEYSGKKVLRIISMNPSPTATSSIT